MITLLLLTKYTDSDLYSARWLDDAYGINYEFNAVHQADGRPLARTEEPSTPPTSWPPKARPSSRDGPTATRKPPS